MGEHITAEPRELDALALAGDTEHGQLVYARRDGADPEDPCRWWPLIGADADPVTWEMVTHELSLTGDGEWLWAPRRVIRLWRAGEESEQVGGHRVVVSTGRCVCHGQEFTPHELDRLRERAS